MPTGMPDPMRAARDVGGQRADHQASTARSCSRLIVPLEQSQWRAEGVPLVRISAPASIRRRRRRTRPCMVWPSPVKGFQQMASVMRGVAHDATPILSMGVSGYGMEGRCVERCPAGALVAARGCASSPGTSLRWPVRLPRLLGWPRDNTPDVVCLHARTGGPEDQRSRVDIEGRATAPTSAASAPTTAAILVREGVVAEHVTMGLAGFEDQTADLGDSRRRAHRLRLCAERPVVGATSTSTSSPWVGATSALL